MKISNQIKNIVLFHLEDYLKVIVDKALNGSNKAYDKLAMMVNDSTTPSSDRQYLQYVLDLIDVYATDGDVEIENVLFTPE